MEDVNSKKYYQKTNKQTKSSNRTTKKMHYNNKKYNLQWKLNSRIKEEISIKCFLLGEMII